MINNQEVAIFAGGCFWCTEPVFSQIKGVSNVESGYIGGHTQNPTYKAICNGDTGHAEAVRITFDADIISFEILLEMFLVAHDPTTLNRQGNDIGTQYRSAVFCQNDMQRNTTQETIDTFNNAMIYSAPIVTQVNGNETFYPAEDYHQQYFAKNPSNPYCLAVAAPKAAKIRQKYAHLIKS